MDLTTRFDVSTSGAPLFVGDVQNAVHWTGREYDGSGVVVSYFGQWLETLPKEYSLNTKKGGERRKVFATLEEAEAFEAKLLDRLKELHPTAAKPPKYPNYPAYYVGATRVFGIERQFTSQFDTITKKLKSATLVPFRRSPRAQALFVDTEGGGPGVVAVDSARTSFAIARVTSADTDSEADTLVLSLGETKLERLKPVGDIRLGDTAVIFDCSFSAAALAAHNWGTASLADGVEKVLEEVGGGTFRVPGQSTPGGAFFRIEKGRYQYALVRQHRAGGAAWDVVWLWRT